MSVIEDSRKLMQDFLAPELRSMAVRLDALEKRLDGFEKRVDKQFDQVERRFEHVDRRFDDVEERAKKRHEGVLKAISDFAELTNMRERIAILESKDFLNSNRSKVSHG